MVPRLLRISGRVMQYRRPLLRKMIFFQRGFRL
jgi:hypothetical protein